MRRSKEHEGPAAASAWPLIPLSHVCSEIYRYPSFYGMEKYDHGIPVIRGEHLLTDGTVSTDSSDYWFVSEEYAHRFPKTSLVLHDIVMSVRGSIGTFSRVGPEHVGAQISPNLIRISPDAALIEPAYLYYALKGSTASQFITSTSSSSAVPAIRATDIKLAKIPVPPRGQQRFIVHILGTLDGKIELDRRMNETLEAVARAIFKSWFVDFDPVRAKAEGRQPLGMDPETAALFPDCFQDSPFGKIPKGWRVRRLADVVADIVSGSRPKGGVKGILNGVPSIGAENVLGLGRYDDSRTRYVPREFFESIKHAAVRNGDVLLYKDGAQLGRKSYFDRDFPFPECCINEHVLILRTNGAVTQRYLYFWLDQPWVTEEIINLNSNSAQPGINKGSVSTLPILVPTGSISAQFEKVVSPLTSRLFENCKESQTLAAIRQALLPKLISGEIRVQDTERFLKERGL